MRELKIKAWDKRNNKWFESSEFILYDGKFFEDYRAFEDYYSLDEHEYELVLSTGLKDKNGKEIFEGDIVRSVVPNHDNSGAIIDYDDEITVFRDIRTAADQFIYLVEPVIVANIYESKGVINL